MNESHDTGMRVSVMDAIRKGKVNMKPRWHFVLFAAFAAIGTALVFALLVYAASLVVFFMRESGAWFAPAFGARGWLSLLRALPWLLLLLVALFAMLLEVLARRYSFVYRRSVLTSLAGVILLVFLGAVAIAQTPLHRGLLGHARRGELPALFGVWYGNLLHAQHPDGLYHGTIAGFVPDGFVLADIEGDGTSTIIITRTTRLPFGADFSEGDHIVVFGDKIATDTVRAFGIREISD